MTTKPKRHHSSYTLTARGRTRPPKGCPVPGLRPLTRTICTMKMLQAPGNSTTGVVSWRSRGGGPLKKAQSGEASSLFPLNRTRALTSTKRGGGTRVDTINEDDSYDNKDDNVASNGHQRMGRGPNNPADWAGNRHPETRPPKAPTRSGRGATVGTGDDNVSSGGMLPSASNNKFESKERPQAQ
jgi:hypothetical protein